MPTGTKRVLNAQDTFGDKIVKSIKAKEITFGKETKVTGTKVGSKYTSKKNESGSYLIVEKSTVKGSKMARASLTLVTPSDTKGMINTNVITGEFARKAFEAVTYVPKSGKKSVLTSVEVKDLNEAFGF